MTSGRRRHTRLSRPSGDSGLMLVELLVGMVLIGVVAGLAGDAIVSALRSQTYVTTRASDLDGLRQAMQRLTRDIRQGVIVGNAEPTGNTLQITVPTSTGSRNITISASGTSLTEKVIDTPTGGASITRPTVTVLSNFDAAGTRNIFGYLADPNYTPANATVVSLPSCADTARPGSFAQQCIGTVTVNLRAIVNNHPDLVLSDTVQVRNSVGGS
jgi:type II secretory pathway pseudopilin PulG